MEFSVVVQDTLYLAAFVNFLEFSINEKFLCSQIFLKIRKYFVDGLNYFIRFFVQLLLKLEVKLHCILRYLAFKHLLDTRDVLLPYLKFDD